jgi:hypothetical protein
MRSSVLYAPAAGSTRCLLFGSALGWLASLARVSGRPGMGAVTTTPLSLGVALSSFCAAFHAARLCLKRLRGVDERVGMALSGALAGAVLFFLRPAEAAAHTELHMCGTVFAVRAAHGHWKRWQNRGRVPIRNLEDEDAGAVMASRGPIQDAGEASKSLRCALTPSNALRVGGCGASTWAFLVVQTRCEMAGVPQHALGWTGMSAACGTALLPAARTCLRAYCMDVLKQLRVTALARLVTGGLGTTLARSNLRAMVVEAGVLGGVKVAASICHQAGAHACLYTGWMPGLGLAMLPSPARETLSTRLAYVAAFGFIRHCRGAGESSRGFSLSVALLEAILLSLGAAAVLHEHSVWQADFHGRIERRTTHRAEDVPAREAALAPGPTHTHAAASAGSDGTPTDALRLVAPPPAPPASRLLSWQSHCLLHHLLGYDAAESNDTVDARGT